MATWKKLNIFWKKTNCPPKCLLIVYDAVIRSKLVYGLDCIKIPEDALNNLNAFQLKGLRKILNMNTTFVNRENTKWYLTGQLKSDTANATAKKTKSLSSNHSKIIFTNNKPMFLDT